MACCGEVHPQMRKCLCRMDIRAAHGRGESEGFADRAIPNLPYLPYPSPKYMVHPVLLVTPVLCFLPDG